MKTKIASLLIILLSLFFAACNPPENDQNEPEKTPQEVQNEKVIDELIDSFENPPAATDPGTVNIDLGSNGTLEEALMGEWQDAANVGMNIDFSENGFGYIVENMRPAYDSWTLLDSCAGSASDSGPYLRRGEGEYSDCFLIVDLSPTKLVIEHQGLNTKWDFKR